MLPSIPSIPSIPSSSLLPTLSPPLQTNSFVSSSSSSSTSSSHISDSHSSFSTIPTSSSNPSSDPNPIPSSSPHFECNICFETANDEPVISFCGHLFCWSCLHAWFQSCTHRRVPLTCPVCKAGCGEDKVIPVFARGQSNSKTSTTTHPSSSSSSSSSSNSLPKRPSPLRPSVTENPFSRARTGGGFHFQAGIGVFPTGLFGFTFAFPGNRDELNEDARQEQVYESNVNLSNVMLAIGFLVLLNIVFNLFIF
ncbi:hypothetical protein HMI54_011956 [Coelomomyces lativittatus]|nr:hypothetical protein HMI54_011956 [Coelomomyces lativittatus]